MAQLIYDLANLRGIHQRGVRSILDKFQLVRMVDDPDFLRLWDDVLDELSKNPTSLYSRHLAGKAVDANKLWDSVQSAMSRRAKLDPRFAKYITNGALNPIHHWNWNKTTFAQWLLDPRQLFLTLDPKLHTGAGMGIHQFLQSLGYHHTKDGIPWWWILNIESVQ